MQSFFNAMHCSRCFRNPHEMSTITKLILQILQGSKRGRDKGKG